MNGIGALDDLSLFMGDDELMGSGSDPLSIRLNNPGAIAKSAFRWDGASAEQPPGRFIAFDTPEDGIRAMARNLDAYGSKYGINTIAGIINRWAPPSENDTREYAATVAKALGVDPNQPLDLGNPRVKAKLMTAMARVEAGRDHYTEDQMLNAIGGGKGIPMQPPMQPEYDVEQGLSNIDQMGQRVAQMGGVSQMPAPPQRVGLSGLDPYLKIAAQIMPERQGSGWGDALINAGAAMMQSRSPDFLGAAGAGLQAGNQALQARRGQDRQDVMDRFKFGMGLAQFDQKDAGEYAMSDGVLYNKKTGSTQQVGAGKAPPTREVKRGDSIVTQEWNGTIWKDIGVADRREVPAGYSRDENGNLQIDPGYMRDQTELRRAGAPSVNVDLKGQTAGAQESAKLDAKKLDGMRSQADAAAAALDDINTVEGWLTGLDTGALAPQKLSAQKFLSGIGVDSNIFGTREQVGKAEAALTLVNQMALKLRSPESGLGMPGALSDKDLAFLKQSVVGLETTEPGRALIIDLTRRAANRRLEIARIADEFYYQNDNSFKGWPQFLKQWREANPLFSDADIATAKQAASAPRSGMPAARGLPESDAERTRRMEQERQDDEKRRGVYTPGTTIPLPPHPQAAPPVGGATTQTPPARRGDIPTFASPDDPALAKLPAGSVFYDNNGVLRVKP